jgi:hypothetical protein
VSVSRRWLAQTRLDLGFLYPIALLWGSVQPGAQSHLAGAIIRETDTIPGLSGTIDGKFQ